MHLVDKSERIRQLNALKEAIEAFLPTLREVDGLRRSYPAYQACLAEVTRLLDQGFSQEELEVLSRGVPRLFWVHKEWTPQLERMTDGSYREPLWFETAERLHQRVQVCAEELRVIGRY